MPHDDSDTKQLWEETIFGRYCGNKFKFSKSKCCISSVARHGTSRQKKLAQCYTAEVSIFLALCHCCDVTQRALPDSAEVKDTFGAYLMAESCWHLVASMLISLMSLSDSEGVFVCRNCRVFLYSAALTHDQSIQTQS